MGRDRERGYFQYGILSLKTWGKWTVLALKVGFEQL